MSLLDTASLICTPNGYKEGKLYSVIPSDGSGDLSVTRATTATRVNSAGLVELVPYNLFSYSQNLANVSWSTYAASGTITRTANYGVAPDGTTTATRIQNSGGDPIQWTYQNILLPSNGIISMYVKRTGASNQTFRFFSNNGATFSSNFTATDTWQRFEFAVGSNTGALPFGITTDSSGTAADILVWGAQIVEGSVAKDYQKTETRLNIPRLDYSNGTCPSILVEPQRTNSCLRSEDFANASWTKAFGSLTSNAITSPSGTLTADKWVENTTNIEHYLEQSFTSIASTTYTFSLYAKAAERSRIVIQLLSVSSPFENVYVEANLIAGTLVVQQGYNGATFVGATIEELPNGWYRITGSGSIGAKTNMRMRIYIANDLGQITYLGNGTSGLYVWGAQLEVGNYSTSYIPTTSASVTRNADVISKTGISSLIGQTEGTLFVDCDCTRTAGIQLGNSVSGSDYVNSIQVAFGSSTTNVNIFNGGVPQFLYASSALTGHHKLAIAYKANDFALYIDGVQVATDTSGSIPSLSALVFNHVDLSTQGYLYNSVALWKTRLTNAELATLTTI